MFTGLTHVEISLVREVPPNMMKIFTLNRISKYDERFEFA